MSSQVTLKNGVCVPSDPIFVFQSDLILVFQSDPKIHVFQSHSLAGYRD